MKLFKLSILLMMAVPYQNCTAPTPDAVPTAVIVGPGSSNLSSVGQAAGTTPASTGTTALVASYAPNPLTMSGTATIVPSNGTAPYTFTLVSGAGTLKGNSYQAPAIAEVAVVGIQDSNGSSGTIQIIVQPTGAAVINPFAGKTPAQISNRACDLAAVTYAVNIATGINYEYCLVLGRYASQTEGNSWYHSIKSQAVAPEALPTALFRSGELQSKYHIDQMNMETYIIFMANQLLFRMPTTDEGAKLMAVGQANGQEGIYNAIISSDAFNAANPFLVAVKNLYQ